MATLSSKLVISLIDRVSGPARGVASSLRNLKASASGAAFASAGDSARRAGQHFLRAGGSAMAASYGLRAIIEPTREFNESVWGTTAALLGQTKALKPAQKQAADLRKTALELSRTYGVMPEVFAKAGEEAAKMGLSIGKSQAVMAAAGKIQMSDRESDAGTMAKSLGTYGIIYGAAEDEAAYAKQVHERASMLALAGAKTRTSASKIEEGMRNYQGVHGAFGGQFPDAVALIAQGSNAGLMEKESGTALKSLTTRFLRMPAEGRAALAASGIDLSKFMDFSAVDPTRATGNLISAFPQQLGKGARGNVQKFLEKAQRDGRLKDPKIIDETLQMLEKQGLSFAGSEDRDAASSKIAAIMHGAGGNFDPLALFSEIQTAIESGRAGPGLMAAIGEPKRLHQYLALIKTLRDAKLLRDELVRDQGRFLELVAQGYSESDAGKMVAMESAWRRFNLALVRSEGLQTAVSLLARLAESFADLPDGVQSGILGMLAMAAILTPLAFALRGIAAAFGAVRAAGAGIKGLFGAAAGGATLAQVFGAGAAGAVATTKGGRAVAQGMSVAGRLAAESAVGAKMIAGMSGSAAAGAAGGGVLARLGLKGGAKIGAKALGRLFWPVTLGLAAWDAYEGYQKGGIKGAALNAATMGLYYAGDEDPAAASATATPTQPPPNPLAGTRAGAMGSRPSPATTINAAGPAVASGSAGPPGLPSGARYQPDDGPSKFDAIKQSAASVPPAVSSAMGQVQSIVAGVDLSSEGARIGESLAAGIRSSIGSIQAAASAAAAAAAQAALRGSYSDGGR